MSGSVEYPIHLLEPSRPAHGVLSTVTTHFPGLTPNHLRSTAGLIQWNQIQADTNLVHDEGLRGTGVFAVVAQRTLEHRDSKVLVLRAPARASGVKTESSFAELTIDSKHHRQLNHTAVDRLMMPEYGGGIGSGFVGLRIYYEPGYMEVGTADAETKLILPTLELTSVGVMIPYSPEQVAAEREAIAAAMAQDAKAERRISYIYPWEDMVEKWASLPMSVYPMPERDGEEEVSIGDVTFVAVLETVREHNTAIVKFFLVDRASLEELKARQAERRANPKASQPQTLHEMAREFGFVNFSVPRRITRYFTE